METDRIEKRITLRAPQSRVWRALTNADEFGRWFRVRLSGPIAPGAQLTGQIAEPGYEHLSMVMLVEQIEPEHRFSYRWHPFPADPSVDYSSEPTTLVEFRLAAVDGGTELTLVESGFDRLPVGRRAEAFRMNEEGWSEQIRRIERYVTAESLAG
jgi:uncharacterized protein YndB with AHSA1/START domain